jgi:hypothetical protein
MFFAIVETIMTSTFASHIDKNEPNHAFYEAQKLKIHFFDDGDGGY